MPSFQNNRLIKFFFGPFFTVFLAFAMLFTGTINTVATKFQDFQIVKGTGRGPPTRFEHAL